MAEVVVVAGWFLAPNINKLIELARCYAVGRYNLHRGLQRSLENLAEDLEAIRVMVDGAREVGFISSAPGVGQLWRLKDAIHDAEEILDMFQIDLQARRNSLSRFVEIGRQVIGNNRSLNELTGLLERLGELRRSSQDLLQTTQLGARGPLRPTTGPMPRRDHLFGYDEEYKKLLSRLSSSDAGVVAIIGNAGTGKTELARQAFNDQQIVRARFDLRIWVCVYGKFTETELLREIWKSAFGRDPAGKMNVASLQQELTEKVESSFGWRRYLLVLDDVCNDESAASDLSRRRTWDTVLAPFKQHGRGGSRILMTTRARICSATLDAGASIELKGIDNTAMKHLLKKTAFGHEHAQVPGELQDVLDRNVGQLHGSPLAAQEVGFMLAGNRNSRNWEESLSRDLHDGVLAVHLSSYQDLPPHLQRCFAFCSIFPKKWRFEPDKLIMMWMALGFVESGGMVSEEDMAKKFFDALLQCSLFQEAPMDNNKSEAHYYVIHEHIHSMIRRVCPTYYLSIDGNSDPRVPIPLTVRHLSVSTSCLDQLKAYPSGSKKLRTLLVFNDDDASSASTLVNLLRRFKGVRVLDISDTGIAELPRIIGEMKHLRYLGLPNNIRNLGARFPRLLFLQTLYLKYIAKMGRIGRLDKLQGSVEFHAGKSEEGYGMGELERLNSLRRLLIIKGLETVASMQEALSAQLNEKKYLKLLKLEWEHRGQQQAEASDSAVLEGLQPHPNLEKLHITGYLGTTSPAWLEEPRALENLRSLYLRNCRELRDLPLVGGLPHLELLNIKNLWSVETINHRFCTSGAFESLEKLALEGMPRLVSWEAEPGIYTPTLFPKLREVKIIDCPRLSSLSGLLYCRNSLIHLHVERCQHVTTTFSRSSFPSLTELYILGCPGLLFKESLPQGALLTQSLLLILVFFAFCIYYKIQ